MKLHAMAAVAAVATLWSAAAGTASAVEITDGLRIDLAATAVAQYGAFDGGGVSDQGDGSVAVDITGEFEPTDLDLVSVTVGFAGNDSLNDVAPVSLSPYADDLEDDVRNINGRNRDYLLTAWYRRGFPLGEDARLDITGGLIDSTGYLDQNEYANDEVGQFMNEIFVNTSLANLPSYDLGAVAELALPGPWSVTFLWLTSEAGQVNPFSGLNATKDFDYYAGQIGFHPETAWGPGNYRLMFATTSDSFFRPAGAGTTSLDAISLSMDQTLTDVLGAFARVSFQDDKAAVTHDVLVSGGLNIAGTVWGRPDDNAGLGYAHLSGANGSGIDSTDAIEGYVRFVVTEQVDLSLDAQYVRDDLTAGGDVDAVIVGARLNFTY